MRKRLIAMRTPLKIVGLGLGIVVLLLGTGAIGASAVLWLNAMQMSHAHAVSQTTPTPSPTQLPTATAIPPTPTKAPKPTATPTAVPRPRPTATPAPSTQLIFDCASATVIDRVQKSYSLNYCIHTSPARPFYIANTVISWCGQPPSSATVSVGTSLNYAGAQTVNGVNIQASCDPPLTIVITARSLTTNNGTGSYPLVGSVAINVPAA